MDTAVKNKSLNLLEFCRRGLSEWQYVDIYQGRLVNVEENVPMLYPNNNLMMTKMFADDPAGQLDIASIPPAELQGLKCTRVTVYDNHLLEDNEVINFKSFVEPTNNNPRLINEGLIKNDLVKTLSQEYKETLYWISKLSRRSYTIVIGILKAIPLLKKKGLKYWSLPNGQQVPLESLKMGLLEYVPKSHTLIRVLHYTQIPGVGVMPGIGVVDLPILHPSGRPDFTSKIKIHRYEPGVGPVLLHYFLHVPLGNDQYYVVDPCSMILKYRGPNKSLIMHGEWKEYRSKFPGQILFAELDFKKNIAFYTYHYDKAYWMGNGPLKFIDRIIPLLVKYIGRRSCTYCGQIEGKHEECPSEYKEKYKHVSHILLNCSRCKKVQYCDRLCQTSDWKNHKADCK